ncbi:MAG: sulfatase-like hydrolase/transferase [Candidatus Aminicenantes bacterium]|nr:sulfatase-like hydrolase/transferase [Candidatus Aminicenantes bacterium]NIM81397.1 sulfatase-like hydrolase/transferase [Candidatus Aminicenantes bacterium]NIN20806.1 sulfatase-like hydrolase/transferase [Candidatus Aminicenantes bacterium]NIN44583.1 sulfatase-like hydrolase/transferase [Candidatus Aminicenantes bacterium]NIN87408.1 sulfatase-like hydrolase/transferase [Candidatus Aminicenantes bacterium]
MKTRNHHRNMAAALGLAAALMMTFLVTMTVNCGSRKSISSKGYNLMVITLDTMRADRIGVYGYTNAQTPNLDQLAANGIMFENCRAPVPLTLPAHCSIFTGRYPLGHRVRDNGTFFLDEAEITLAEKMKTQGHQTVAVIASFVLLSKFGLNQGFDVYDDSLNIDQLITSFDSEIKADQVYTKFSKWLKKYQKQTQQEKEKFFAWIHFYDPHTPYEPPEHYKEKFGSHLEALYDGEVAFTDLYVGKIIADLESAHLIDQTLIIIVGDHGEAFGEHNEFGHSFFCYEENLRVPLVFYNPRLFLKPRRIKNRVNLVDIMPTVLEMYGQETPGTIHGKSFTNLLTGKKDENQRTFYIESMHGKEEMGWAPLTGIIKDRYKYISLPEPELYDLANDTKEKENLFWKKNQVARSLDKTLMNLVKTYSLPATASPGSSGRRTLTQTDKQHLQSLGYISAFSGKDKTGTNIDPKKGILLKNQLTEIEKEIDAGRLDLAESHLKDLAEKNPQQVMPQYFGMLNTIYKKKNDIEGVIAAWKKAIETFPRNDHFKINLAFEYYHMNRLEESEKLAIQIIENNAKYTRAYILKGRIQEKRGRVDEALVYFEKALISEPQNVSLKINYAKLLGQNRDFPKALDICQELLADESVSADPGVKGKIGIVLAEIHKNDKAFQVLNDVVEAGKANAETWNYLGILYFRKRNFTQSLQAYQTSIELDPKIAKTYNNLGTLYLTLFQQQKDPRLHRQAINAFNKALELDPNLASALNGRGSAFIFANRIRDALKDWEKAITIKPDFTDIYFNIGITYLQLKSRQKALKYLNICKEKYYHMLSPRDRQRLNRLIREAGGGG